MSNATENVAVAAHVSATTDSHRIDGVGVWNLHVMVYQERETKLWVSQGMEIDYVAQGVSPAEAKKCFEEGFLAAIDAHLTAYGDIKRLCNTTIPQDVYLEMQALRKKPLLYSQMSVHIAPLRAQGTLNIDYLTEPDAA